MTICDTIQAHGGPAEFSRLTGVPLDTAKQWSCGLRVPSPHIAALIRDALKWRHVIAYSTPAIRTKLRKVTARI
jgi:hypothetical protein